jgi:cytochrome P450
MIIQESMRLFPPVWSFHRVSINEDKLGDFIIPANSYLMICPYALHRHLELWEKPNEFYPEHFKQGNFQGKAFTYIPFGQGKRMCIGKPLAMAELQLIFTMFMSELNFELASNKEPIIVPGIIIKSKKPLLMNITSLTN